MNFIYELILDFINAFFPNTLRIELLEINELLAYVVTIVLCFSFVRWVLKFFNVIKK